MTTLSRLWPGMERRFIAISILLLASSSILKLISLIMGQQLLHKIDPILGLPNSTIFGVFGLGELAMAVYLLLSKATRLQLLLIAWVGTVFTLYHLALVMVGGFGCPCLGSSMGWLGLGPARAAEVSMLVAAYLMVGGCLFIVVKLL